MAKIKIGDEEIDIIDSKIDTLKIDDNCLGIVSLDKCDIILPNGEKLNRHELSSANSLRFYINDYQYYNVTADYNSWEKWFITNEDKDKNKKELLRKVEENKNEHN